MALILTAAAAYAAYAATQQGGEKGESVPDVDESIDLTGKVELDLLPIEVTLDVMEAPISTITFVEGNYQEAAALLQTRVAEIVYRNPFLGGWLIKKPGEKYPKLVFDPSSDDVCQGILEVVEPGQVDLSYTDTSYQEYGAVIGKHGKVPLTISVINRNREPLFRVAVIPDARHTLEKFSLVVSMSHQCGDPFTFYKIHDMLVNTDATVEALNPHRKLDFSTALIDQMGRQEAFYIRNALTSPMWEWSTSKTNKPAIRRKFFYISEKWFKEKQQETGHEENGAAVEVMELSRKSILSWWFFNTVQPTVGFVTHNFRHCLPKCHVNDQDAGTYHSVIPFASTDYTTPWVIEKSFAHGKRCALDADSSLPGFQRGATYSAVTDWSCYSTFPKEFLSADTAFRPLMHLPLYGFRDLETIPDKLSFFNLFNASPAGDENHRLAAFAMVPESVMGDIEASGIVEETIADF